MHLRRADRRYSNFDASKLIDRLLAADLRPDTSDFFPQITQIDADFVAKGPGLYLRYLRYLRAKWGGLNVGNGIGNGNGWLSYTPPPWKGFLGSGTS